MTELATAHPMMGDTAPFAIYHRVFCYWCSEIMANEFVCWAAIQQYRHAPSKRRAIFIADTWLQDAGAAAGTSTDMSILEPINTGSKGGRFKVEAREALLTRVAELKSVKTWTGKLKNWSNRSRLGAVPSDLLDAMAQGCEENLTGDVLARRVMDTDRAMLGSGHYAKSLRADIPTMTAVGFDTKAMGVW